MEFTDPLERFLVEDVFNSAAEVGRAFGSSFSVTVNMPSVDALPPGLLMLMLTVDVLSLDDKCSTLV